MDCFQCSGFLCNFLKTSPWIIWFFVLFKALFTECFFFHDGDFVTFALSQLKMLLFGTLCTVSLNIRKHTSILPVKISGRDERTLSTDLCGSISFNEKFCPIIAKHFIVEGSVNFLSRKVLTDIHIFNLSIRTFQIVKTHKLYYFFFFQLLLSIWFDTRTKINMTNWRFIVQFKILFFHLRYLINNEYA